MRVRILILMFLLAVANSTLFAQESTNLDQITNDTTKVANFDSQTVTSLTDFKSIWEITKLGGELRWVIFLVLIVGLASVMYKYAEFFVDIKKARPINRLNLQTASLPEIEDVVRNNPDNLIHYLFSNMLSIFRTTERAEDFHYEITNFDQVQQDKFAIFKSKMCFLSDTAGALGLLGTVWGMFVTFFRGILDNQVILTGMGIALVTTLMGLVSSIIINFFTTQLEGFFRRKIDSLLKKGDELRLQLLRLQKKQLRKVHLIGRRYDDFAEIKDQMSENMHSFAETNPDQVEFYESDELELDLDNEEEDEDGKYLLATVSGDNQIAVVNSRLKHPFVVQVLNGDDKGVTGHPVVFQVERGNGTLENGNKTAEVTTDVTGFAKNNLVLGNVAGENVVKVSLKRNNGRCITFKAEGYPATPTILKYISGNLQNSPAGQELKKPFVVQLLDGYNNPIYDQPVIFKVKIGKGFFPGKKRTYITRTDKSGIAQTYFTLRPEPGFNSITAYAKGLKRSKIEFEALGQ